MTTPQPRFATRQIEEGEYHIVFDRRATSYPYDVVRRLDGRDYRINSFKTEVHARYFAAANNIARRAVPQVMEAV